MDKYRRPSESSGDWLPDDASLTAELLRNDFSGLIEIFNRHFEALSPDDGQARKHVAQARAAAERGLNLSRELIELTKAPG